MGNKLNITINSINCICLLLVKVFAVELKPAIIQDALFRGKTLLINSGE